MRSEREIWRAGGLLLDAGGEGDDEEPEGDSYEGESN